MNLQNGCENQTSTTTLDSVQQMKKSIRKNKNNNNCQTLKEMFEQELQKKLSQIDNCSISQDIINNINEEELNKDNMNFGICTFNNIQEIQYFSFCLVLKLVPCKQNRLINYRKVVMNVNLNLNIFSPHTLYNEIYIISMYQLEKVCEFIQNKKILIKQDLQIIHSFGDWISKITLQSDRPFFLNKIDLKKQIWLGVQMRFLNNIVLLVCIIIKGIKDSQFFKIENPHINAIIDILREILQINWALQSTKTIIRELFIMLNIENSQIHFFGYLQRKMQNKDQQEVLIDHEFLPDQNKLQLSCIVDANKDFQKYIEYQQILATSIEQTVKDMVTEFSQHILDQVMGTIKSIGVKDFLGIDSLDIFSQSLQNMFKNLTWNIIASLYLDKLEEKFNHNLQAIFYQQKLNKGKDFDYNVRKLGQENIQYLTTLFRDNFLRIGIQNLLQCNWFKKQLEDRKIKQAESWRGKDLKWLEQQLPRQLNIQAKSQEIVDVEIYQKLSQEESLKIAPYELNPFMLWVKDQTEFYNEWESNVIIDLIIEIDSILSNVSLEKKVKFSKTQQLYSKVKKKLLKIQNNSMAIDKSAEHILKKLFISVQQNITIEKIKVYRDLLALLQTQWPQLKDKVTQWVFEQKYIRPQIFIWLIKKGLVNLKMLDEQLKIRIEKYQDLGLQDFVIILRSLLIDEKIFEIFQFPQTLQIVVTMLKNNSVQSDHQEVIMFLETIIKNVDSPYKLSQELQLGLLEPEYLKLQKDVQEYFEILDDDVYKQMVTILNKWITKTNEEQVRKIIMEFHRNIYIKNKRIFSLFFCYLFEYGINDSIKKSSPNDIQNFKKQNYDLIDVINTFIMKLIQASPNQSHILESIMTPLIILFTKFYNFGSQQYSQKPFFFVIWNLIRGISNIQNSQHFLKIVVIFDQTLHILRPSKFPKFSFAWLNLISDKFLIQYSLSHQQNWNYYYKLLIDLLLFIKRDFNIQIHQTEEGQSFIEGVLKLFLVMAINYQEFLYCYFYQLLEEIPQELIQLRNILLRMYPVRTELPSPFQQDFYKVQNLIQFREMPKLTSLLEARIQASDLDICIENYLNLENHDDPIEKLNCIYEKFIYQETQQKKFNELLISSFTVYLPMSLFKQSQGDKQVVFNMKQNKSFELLIRIFDKKNIELNEKIVDGIMDNLRYPNPVTFYYANFVLLYIQEFGNSFVVELMITKLLSRIYVHGPHPWGLLFLFFQIITNPIIEGTKFYQQNQDSYQQICQPSF